MRWWKEQDEKEDEEAEEEEEEEEMFTPMEPFMMITSGISSLF